MNSFSSIDIICGLHVMIKNIQDNQNKLMEKMDDILNEFEIIKVFCSTKDNIILKIQETISTNTNDIRDIRSFLDMHEGYQKIKEDDENEDEEEEDDENEDEEEEEDEDEEEDEESDNGSRIEIERMDIDESMEEDEESERIKE